VLVVDDNVINQQVAREVLLRAGVLVELAGSGVEAVLMVDQQPFDAVLMDIQMPAWMATRPRPASAASRSTRSCR
jgi:CheY-like chemotaxis protein